jgi:hypothetical protein
LTPYGYKNEGIIMPFPWPICKGETRDKGNKWHAREGINEGVTVERNNGMLE